jgi:hypothetical protein
MSTPTRTEADSAEEAADRLFSAGAVSEAAEASAEDSPEVASAAVVLEVVVPAPDFKNTFNDQSI